MQTGTGPVQEAASKPLLLGLTAAIVVGIIAPLVLPHVPHQSMIYHVVLHMASVTIAAFLSIVSLLAYRRAGGSRTLFMTLGFLALGAVEVSYLLQAAGIPFLLDIPNLNIEAPHLILLVMLSLFGLGVLKVNK
ncbi:hypothetical protein [Nitrososphaera sp.]|uniref:hypothetical protein n=1 Tax=Nitrososphaera sp. TaxID=1971748 RepID=UPI00307CD040